MPNNIQTIIDKFETNFPDKIARVIDDFGDTTKSDLKDFLKDSLTSMLDGIEKELPKEEEKIAESLRGLLSYDYPLGLKEGKNSYRQEVINIIN